MHVGETPENVLGTHSALVYLPEHRWGEERYEPMITHDLTNREFGGVGARRGSTWAE